MAEPWTGPFAELVGQLADRAPAELDRVRDDGADVPQAGELSRGIGHGAGHQRQAHRPTR